MAKVTKPVATRPRSDEYLSRPNVLLVSRLKPEYYSTFYSWKTGHEQSREYFTLGKDDEMKLNVFTARPEHWKSIAGDVKAFTHANWARWTVEKPAWFTADIIAMVPDEFIPEDARLELDAAEKGGKRRRSSVRLFGQAAVVDP